MLSWKGPICLVYFCLSILITVCGSLLDLYKKEEAIHSSVRISQAPGGGFSKNISYKTPLSPMACWKPRAAVRLLTLLFHHFKHEHFFQESYFCVTWEKRTREGFVRQPLHERVSLCPEQPWASPLPIIESEPSWGAAVVLASSRCHNKTP